MVERPEITPRSLPMALLDGEKVERELREKNSLLLPEGTKAILMLSLTDKGKLSLGPTRLTKDFEGTLEGEVLSTEFHGLPRTSRRINLIPFSKERKIEEVKLQRVLDILKPLQYKIIDGEAMTEREMLQLERLSGKDDELGKKIAGINKILAKDFLADRQDDLDFFYINPNDVEKITLQVAVNRSIRIPS